MEEKLAPVALFVYNRPHHTLATLTALAENRLASSTDLIIFSDGSKSDDDKDEVTQTRKIISEVKGFKSVSLKLSESNKGLATSIIEGVTKLLHEHNSLIVLEDDLLASPGFLEYMNAGLQYYKRSNIYSISGYTPNLNIPTNYPYSTYFAPRNCSWGWATWSDKWMNIDWTMADFDHFYRSPQKIKAFNAGGNDLSTMLMKCKMGVIKSWSIRFSYHIFKNGGGAIYPTKSLIKNIGIDGTGTNMSASCKYDVETVDSIESKLFCNPSYINTNILKEFKRFYNTSIIRAAINIIKRRKYLLLS